jgi:energy-coupling factor transporter ATP-binding protein EcfA2
MTESGAAAVDSVRTRPGNPFPGLRPFEPHESSLFFGRDEQCDDLLTRLARGRLVAVVGMSGSGKTSLVRAGLLPALDRGYLPAAGSSWHIAIFRPGSDPVANLTRALVSRRRPGGTIGEDHPDEVRSLLDASSLGLVAAARRLLTDSTDALLVVADQFEEIFRFGRIARAGNAQEQAAACVDLLINASRQDDVPVYVVLTMRSDYLGDCAHFTGLPEALNDSQFLVPRMTRAQLRAAIECPVAVGGARISPRLVQRLLYEVDGTSSRAGEARGESGQPRDQDQLPVLQHALMRVWEVSRAAREHGEPIDVPHYEQPPVETLRHALDRHAEEVYRALPTDSHREVARLVFQQLTDRDAENREVRRPTPLPELTAVALHSAPETVTPAQAAVVNDVIAAFAADGRAFVVVNAQQDVDISHESFIRKWERLRTWVEEENRSRRIYAKLADAASSWDRGEASLYRGPELAEARRWWQRERPTRVWASRYHSGFEVAQRFLTKSIRGRRLRRGLLFGNVALLVVAVVAIAVLMAVSRAEARRAEAAALEARNATASANSKLAEANKLFTQALEAQKQGKSTQAAALQQQAQQFEQQANAKSVLTPSELTELDRLRRQESERQRREADLRQQLAGPIPDAVVVRRSDLTELERLRKAESSWEGDRAQLQQQLAAVTDRATKSQQAADALTKTNQDLQARLAAETAAAANRSASSPRSESSPGIEQLSEYGKIYGLLAEYQLAYEELDAATVARLMPSAPADLARSFSQLRSYRIRIIDPRISITGDTAVATGVRQISAEPKVGTRQNARTIPTVFKLRKSGDSWIIESIEEFSSGGRGR